MNKILRFKKSKGNTYQVTLDSRVITLYDDIITKYELIRKHKISDEELEIIIKENKSLNAYYKALSYLNRRLRTEKEVRSYLIKQGFLDSSIENAICKLKEKNFLNENQYIELYIGDSIRLKSDGKELIKKKLIDLGLSKELIDSHLNNVDLTIWQEKAQKLIDKKNKSTHKEAGYIWKQKLELYLRQNGYTHADYQELLENMNMEENRDLLEKEINKWLKKYASKFQGEELKRRVKQKLYQKGYQKESVEECLKKAEDF